MTTKQSRRPRLNNYCHIVIWSHYPLGDSSLPAATFSSSSSGPRSRSFPFQIAEPSSSSSSSFLSISSWPVWYRLIQEPQLDVRKGHLFGAVEFTASRSRHTNSLPHTFSFPLYILDSVFYFQRFYLQHRPLPFCASHYLTNRQNPLLVSVGLV